MLSNVVYPGSSPPPAKCIGDDNGDGFIWHASGCGKAFISFKACSSLKKTTTSTNAPSPGNAN